MAESDPVGRAGIYGTGVHASGGGAAGRHSLWRGDRSAAAFGGRGLGGRQYAARPVFDPVHPAGFCMAAAPHSRAGGDDLRLGAKGGDKKTEIVRGRLL